MVSGLKARLAAGEIVVAVNIGGANVDLVEALGRLKADLAFVDCERTGLGLDSASALLRAARAARLPAVVRSWSPDPGVLVQYLDRKADGLVVPRIESAREAEAVVETVRYACGADGASGKLVIVQIESRDAVAAIDEIAAVDGVDVFLLGPNDLGYSMTGVRGARTPETEQAIDHVCTRLAAAGRSFGMPARIGELDTFRRRGATFLYYPVEWLLERALGELDAQLGR
jgi:4-hydroxy-2-oxoheptanedioate aldolase